MKISRIETGMLLLFVVLFLFLGPATTYNHTFDHSSPQGWFAMDFGWKSLRADILQVTGDSSLRPAFLSAGYVGGPEIYPPLWTHHLALSASASGLDPAHIAFFMVMLNLLLMILCCYEILRKVSTRVALCGLPLGLLMIGLPYAVPAGFGFHSMVFGHMFLMAGALLILNFSSEKWFGYALGVVAAAAFLSHPPEAAYLAGLYIIYLGWQYYSTKDMKILKPAIIAAVLSLLVIAAYLPVLLPHEVNNPDGSQISTLSDFARFKGLFNWEPHPSNRIPVFSQFGYLAIPIAIGMLLSLFYKRRDIALAFLYFFILNFMPYLGIVRFEQFRYFWPIYAIFFLGLAGKVLIDQIPINKKVLHIGVFSVLVLFIGVTMYQPMAGTAIQPQEWRAAQWLQESTPEDSKILHIYEPSASTQKSAMLFSHRIIYHSTSKDFNQLVSSGIVTRNWTGNPISNYRKVHERIGVRDVRRVDLDDLSYSFVPGPMDFCGFDFYVINPYAMSGPQQAYANKIFKSMINASAKVVHQEDALLVLRPTRGDCLA
jgi:hypothetical protein